ncbi:MAG: tautomerase family protein [Actinomycetota bacterium]|nr:tautomerase family protein [Actinomycetota bacterium]
MPFYHAIVRPEVLAPADREALSKDVTNVHCDVTGAPRTFVHVLYTVDDANRLPDDIDVLYRANIRSGRTTEQKAELTTRLQNATAERTSASASRVAIHIEETEASFVMEGGSLLPEPGSPEEEAWKALDA